MQNANDQNPKTRKARTTNELGRDFKFIRELGAGQFGAVELYQYVGDNEDLKKLCNDRGEIGVKFQTVIDINEAEIGIRLLDHAKKQPNQNQSFNLIMPLTQDDNIVAILTNPIFYNKSDSANLEGFFKKIAANSGVNANQVKDPWQTAFSSGLSITLSQLASSMFAGLEAMHEAYVLHIDDACRNYLMAIPQFDAYGNIINVFVINSDYGLSGVLSGEEQTFFITEAIAKKVPIRFMDSKSVNERTASITTDIFALKTTLIEMLGYAAGAKDNYKTICCPGYTNISARFNDDSPYTEDTDVLKIYLQNVIKLLENCPKEKREEIELFMTCYAEYLTSLPDENMSHDQKKADDKKLFLKANDKFIVESMKAKHGLLDQIDTLELTQYAQLEDKALLVKRLLAIPVSDGFRSSPSYQRLLDLQLKCQVLNQQFVTHTIETTLGTIEQLSTLPFNQLQEKSQLVNKLLSIDVSDKYRNEDKNYQQLLDFRKNITSLNEKYIEETLASNRPRLKHIYTLNKFQQKEKSELVNRLLTLNVSDDFRKSDSFAQLIKYHKRFHSLSNEQSIKKAMSSNLTTLDQVHALNKDDFSKQATLVNRLLTTDVTKRFRESDSYQHLLQYQEKFTLLFVERHIASQYSKLLEKIPAKDESQWTFYVSLNQMYNQELVNIKNEFNGGNFINIQQALKRLKIIDNQVKEKLSARNNQVTEQLAARDNLLSDYYKIENNIIENLKKYKWAFSERVGHSTDPQFTAIQELKEKFSDIRMKIKTGEITELDSIKKILIESLNTLGDQFREIQQKTVFGRVGLSSSKTAEKVDESITELKRSPGH